MMSGTRFGVGWADPRQELATVCANTSWRPKPMTRPAAVSAAMRTAARPMALVSCRGRLGSGFRSVTGRAGLITEPFSSVEFPLRVRGWSGEDEKAHCGGAAAGGDAAAAGRAAAAGPGPGAGG